MATKREYIHGITRCAGDCGRMVRPNNLLAADHPGTVQRFADGRCKYCYRRTLPTPVRGEGKVVQPCKSCGHPTRPGKVKAAAFPGTRLRIGELCRACDSAGGTVPPERVEYVRSEVEYFNRSRRNRGIPPEGLTMKEAS